MPNDGINTAAKIGFILIGGLMPALAGAVEFRVGVGLSEGGDHAAVQQDYARLRQDIRALQRLAQQLDVLASRETPPALADEDKAEWSRQSEWLLRQSEAVAALAEESADYLDKSGPGRGAPGLFDYQSMKFRIVQRLDVIETAAGTFEIKGKEAGERRDSAVKLLKNAL